jgi:prepilin-type N-terminal cleavage/methylation domain-containing protein
MSPLFPRPLLKTQRGLSLIEVMIAITLSLILMAGLIQFFIGNKQSLQVQQAINGLQENGRYAMRVVTDSLHMADHWGGVEANLVSGTPAVAGIGGCDAAWILNVAEGIRGFEGAAAVPMPAGCVAAADYQPNTDAFVVRHAGGTYFPGATANATGNNGIWVNTRVGFNSTLSTGTAVSAVDENGLYHYPYQVSLYYIRPCSNPAGANCAATDDGGNPIPTLVRLNLDGNQLTEQALVSGVEQMQIEYGVDTNADNDANFYASAAAVGATQWARVVSARISLVVRGEQRGTLTDTTTYAMPGGFNYTPAANDQMYARKVFTRIVQIRNRSRS